MTEWKYTNNNYVTNRKTGYIFTGKAAYEDVYALQLNCKEKVARETSIYIIGTEHPAVITLGYRASAKEEVQSTNTIPIVSIKRGGFATLHSEGQLVIYPILNLVQNKLGVRSYVELLLNTTIELLQLYNIRAVTDAKQIGVFTDNGKIAFCGIQVSNGVTLHGLSLNVYNDLSLFQNIRSCGVNDAKFDSFKLNEVQAGLEELFSRWVEIFEFKLN